MQVMLRWIPAACWAVGLVAAAGVIVAFAFRTHFCAAVPVLSHCLSLLSKMPLFRTRSFLIWKPEGHAYGALAKSSPTSSSSSSSAAAAASCSQVLLSLSPACAHALGVLCTRRHRISSLLPSPSPSSSSSSAPSASSSAFVMLQPAALPCLPYALSLPSHQSPARASAAVCCQAPHPNHAHPIA